MAWKNESRRHSLARRGIKTADGSYGRSPNQYTKYWYEMQIALDRYLGLTEIGLDVEKVKRIKDPTQPQDLEYTFKIDGREFTVQFTFLRREGITDLKFVPESDLEIFDEMHWNIEQGKKASGILPAHITTMSSRQRKEEQERKNLLELERKIKEMSDEERREMLEILKKYKEWD